MKVRALKQVNHKDRTVKVGEVIELDDVAAKKLIEVKAVEEVKESVAPAGVNIKTIENKQSGDAKWWKMEDT